MIELVNTILAILAMSGAVILLSYAVTGFFT